MKHFKRYFNILLSIALLTLMFTTPVSAKEKNPVVNEIAGCQSTSNAQSVLESVYSQTFEVTEKQKQALILKAKNDLATLTTITQPHISEGVSLAYDQAIVRGTSIADITEYAVVLPMVGQIEKGSSYSLVYSTDGDLVRTIETQFIDVDEEFGNVKAWLDGNLLVDERIEKESQFQTYSFWSCMNDCLADQGIAAWALAGLGILCGALCAVTFGTGCVICIQGSGLVFATTIDYCLGQCGP